MPRYWDACRTFITSRDSLTRNAHPTLTRLDFGVPAPVRHRRMIAIGRGLAHVMSSRLPERQALLFGNCPKNIGNLRQLTWYCRQVPQYTDMPALLNHNMLYFRSPSRLSRRTVILCVHLPCSHTSRHLFVALAHLISTLFGSFSLRSRGSSRVHRCEPWSSRPSRFHPATAA